jgi:hypothetical protein
MSAIEKVNCSGLSVDEKRALKALMCHKPSIRDQIAEDSAVDDGLLRAYLNVPGKKASSVYHALFSPCSSSFPVYFHLVFSNVVLLVLIIFSLTGKFFLLWCFFDW